MSWVSAARHAADRPRSSIYRELQKMARPLHLVNSGSKPNDERQRRAATGNVIMDMSTVQLAQLVVAASVAYVMHITFFKPKAGDKDRMKQIAAVKYIVKQRSERWAV